MKILNLDSFEERDAILSDCRLNALLHALRTNYPIVILLLIFLLPPPPLTRL